MINDFFLNRIKKYNPNSITEIKNAMREVLQDIILVAIGKSDFFNSCVFYGGTSLRIFRELPRFSEDLDFTLFIDKEIELINYMHFISKELNSCGIQHTITEKNKSIEPTVESRYINFNLKYLFEISFIEYVPQIIDNEILSIKVELEKNHFAGGKTELKLLTYPSFAQIRTFDIETLFASKLLAVLKRKWKTRIKGRDFYDYLFYISLGTKVNMVFLENGLKKFGHLNNNDVFTIDNLKNALKERFEQIDFEKAKEDVKPFISSNDKFIDSFNKDIFISTIDLIKC